MSATRLTTCPSWCERGHEDDADLIAKVTEDGDGRRHQRTIGRLEAATQHGEACVDVSVTIEMLELVTMGAEGVTSTYDAPSVCLFGDSDDMTSRTSRQLAALLLEAADQRDAIQQAGAVGATS